MQYVGTLLDGTEFDSSSGGYPFTFELGKGIFFNTFLLLDFILSLCLLKS